MPLDPEVIAAIQEAVKTTLPAVIGESIKPLSEQVDKIEKQQRDTRKLADSVSALSNNLSEQLSKQIDEKFGTITPSLDFLNELKKEAETEASQSQPQSKNDLNIDELKVSLMNDLKGQYETKLQQIRQQLEERDKEAQALRDADRQSRMRNDVLNQMRGLGTLRPNTEEDLLTLLEKRGLLVEDGDRLYIKSTDKFGDPTKAEFKELLPKMLETDFAHFANPRGGTGTDAVPSNRTSPQSSQYDFSKLTAQEIYDRYNKDPEAMKSYNQLLEQQFGKS